MRSIIGPTTLLALVTALHTLTARSEQALGVVWEVDGIDRALSDMHRLASVFASPFEKDKKLDELRSDLGLPDIGVVDTSGPMSTCVVFPAAEQGRMPEGPGPVTVHVVTLKVERGELIEALSEAYGRMKTERGVPCFVEPARKGLRDRLCLAVEGQRAAIGPDPGAVLVVRKWLAGRAEKGVFPSVWPQGGMRLGVSVPVCLPLLRAGIEQMTSGIASAGRNTPAGKVPEGMDPARLLQVEAEGLLAVAEQIEEIGLSLRIEGERLELSSRMRPVADTVLAGLWSRGDRVSERYLAALPRDALLAMAGSGMEVWDTIAEPYGDWVQKLYAAMGPEAANMSGPLEETMKSLHGLYAGDFAMGLVPAPEGGLAMVQVSAVRDAGKARAVIEEVLAQYRDSYAGLVPGLSLLRKPDREYRDVSIMCSAMAYDEQAASRQDAATPTPPVPPWVRNMRWELAFVGSDMLYVMGAPAAMDAAIDRLLEDKGARLDRHPDFLRHFPEPPRAGTCMRLAPMALLKAALSASPDVNPALLGMLPPAAGSLAGYGLNRDNGRMEVWRLDLSELSALKSAAPLAMAVLAQSTLKKGMPAGAPARPADPRARCARALHMIEAAKEMCALDENLQPGAHADPEKVKAFLKDGKLPVCPAGGEYTLHPVGHKPSCSIHGEAP